MTRYKISKEDLEKLKDDVGEDGMQEAIQGIMNCDHICTSDCRREGCNCDCGEWHVWLEKVEDFPGEVVNELTEKN